MLKSVYSYVISGDGERFWRYYVVLRYIKKNVASRDLRKRLKNHP